MATAATAQATKFFVSFASFVVRKRDVLDLMMVQARELGHERTLVVSGPAARQGRWGGVAAVAGQG